MPFPDIRFQLVNIWALFACFEGSPSGIGVAVGLLMTEDKRFVYVLKSNAVPTRYYTGLTSNLGARIDAQCRTVPHTASAKPWAVDVIVEFSDEHRAVAFEKYLKSGSAAHGSNVCQRPCTVSMIF